MSFTPWGIILAGGGGTRLKSVSRFISGDNRPKQFCVLFGSRSLLARTRGRLAPAISPDRTMFAVVREHERFYGSELSDVDESRIVVQPANRGTTPAIIYSLLRLTRLEKEPVAAFFPADHHFADEAQFARAVEQAFAAVGKHPDRLILLGARADKAQVEYGWIEPGQIMQTEGDGALPVFRVNRFWEKPAALIAQELLIRGCFWNTFVIVGRARAFLDAIEATVPDLLNAFQTVADSRAKEEEMQRAAALYDAIPTGDFSREVLTQCPARLAVLQMEDAGWGDLGTPEGVLVALQKTAHAPQLAANNAFSQWLASYRRQLDQVRRQPTEKATATPEPR